MFRELELLVFEDTEKGNQKKKKMYFVSFQIKEVARVFRCTLSSYDIRPLISVLFLAI